MHFVVATFLVVNFVNALLYFFNTKSVRIPRHLRHSTPVEARSSL
jgi:hypothetical protein